MYSPSPLMSGVPTVCPVLLLRCVISKSPEVIVAAITVVPELVASSFPVSCSKYILLPSVLPTTSDDALSLGLYLVACGLSKTAESCQVVLARVPVVHIGRLVVESP